MDLFTRKMEIQNAVKADLEKKKIAEPPDFWAAPAPAPDQNFGGSGPCHILSG